MHIAFVEISNFRKLLAIRIDFNRETTLFVGANSSGKTSAMLAPCISQQAWWTPKPERFG